MSEHTEQTAALADAVPARIQLDDFIEAVTRGVARALAAQDEVSGYAFNASESKVRPVYFPSGVTMGLIFYPPPGSGSYSGDAFGGGTVGSVR